MKSLLEKISTINHMSFDLYQKGYEVWKNSNETEKQDFYNQRIDHLFSFAGVFYDHATVIETSGTSTGLIKKYLWGPDFHIAHRFHDFLCFGDVNPSIFLELYFLTGDSLISANLDHIRKNHKRVGLECDCYILACAASKQSYEIIDKFVLNNTSNHERVIIKLIPSQAHIVISQGQKFFDYFNPKKYIFQVTGETCTESVKDYFNQLGLELRDSMKIWNGGASFYTCKYGNLHWDDFTCYYHKNHENKLVCTDLFNLSQMFHHVPTGDVVKIKNHNFCNCGLITQENNWNEKFSFIVINDNAYNWMDLRNDFGVILNQITKNEIFWWQNLLGVSIGLTPESIYVFYECKEPIAENDMEKVKNALQLKWNKKVFIKRGLKNNRFKTKRVFYMDEERKIF